MSRQGRKYYNTSFFHIIVQGINKEYIFNNESNIEKYLELIRKYKVDTNIQVLAYCMMDNHAHFLIFSKEITEISKLMHKTNTMYAKYYNEKSERVGYVFRDRFVSQPITDTRYLIKCINYIHNNPVKANMVASPDEYKYSSYNNFKNGENIKLLLKITGIKFDIEQFKVGSPLEYFADVDIDRGEMLERSILEMCKRDNVELYKIFEDRKVLKEIIKQLKNDCKIKYTEIMRKLKIPRGVMEHLK